MRMSFEELISRKILFNLAFAGFETSKGFEKGAAAQQCWARRIDGG